jgi:Fe-S-cluster containining protein
MTPEERAQEVLRLEGTKIAALVHAAARLARASMPADRKRQQIVHIAAELSRAITPRTACARGCSECCHMNTSLSGHEARKIGRYVGREPRRLGRERSRGPTLADELRVRFTGVPCPFLEAGRCSIYPVRPIACRTHHTMRDDETGCRLRLDAQGRAINPTPSLDVSAIGIAAAAIFAGEDFGDIREYFPPGQ